MRDIFGTKFHVIDKNGTDRTELNQFEWMKTLSSKLPSNHRLMQAGARTMRYLGDNDAVVAYLTLSKG